MRQGWFERHRSPDGRVVFRLRWDAEAAPPSVHELRRFEFLRFLVRSGRLSEQLER